MMANRPCCQGISLSCRYLGWLVLWWFFFVFFFFFLFFFVCVLRVTSSQKRSIVAARPFAALLGVNHRVAG